MGESDRRVMAERRVIAAQGAPLLGGALNRDITVSYVFLGFTNVNKWIWTSWYPNFPPGLTEEYPQIWMNFYVPVYPELYANNLKTIYGHNKQ